MPAFVSMVAMPYTFSIGYGIIGGLLLWTLGMIFFVSRRCTLQNNPLKLQRMPQMPRSSFSKLGEGGVSQNQKVLPFISHHQFEFHPVAEILGGSAPSTSFVCSTHFPLS